ncbi:M10 family metallopeptidase C-terminal domain-containing protein [Primorskyibacter aestuariivivens]|uniref:M10 family metallopeptidase C-terminal domain-containing protein n=1 Tax=Primorskyibacter aestuariivivens TaxID=1888912 RepID=UPI0023012C51|nr:M10 family metallopeptidase C-terminal domain-containing protein [Primorskyibacter aestuariivivens]MDA7429621.1 M10 family metallopeptidase C-terminal domain-containing protein [Primorskyibacter aestuariivivens]
MTGTFDPTRHPESEDGSANPIAPDFDGSASLATITELADAADSIATTYSMQVGDTFSGEIGFTGDRDWVAVTLQAGQSYEINLSGAPSGAGTLADPYLRLYDSSGNLVTFNDDGGPGLESSLTFTATSGGTYYVAAGAWDDSYSGTYQMSVNAVAPPQVASLDELANYLTDGYWNDQGFSTFRFDTSASNQITVNITNLTAEGQQLARWALEAWEMVADLQFVEVTGTAQINFDDSQPGAFAGPDSVVGGFTTTASVNVGTGWLTTYGTTLDSYSFQTYVHEIGHALGLGHQGGYNGAATYGVDEDFANDSWQLSIMSYFSQTQNTTVNASYALVMSAMMADIVAIQNLYGAAGGSSSTAGNTIWGGTNSNLGNYLDDIFDYLAGGTGNGNVGNDPMAFTIFDQGGTDLVDMSDSTTNDRFDMRSERFSDVGGLIGNVGIARGTVIENLNAGSGNDTITGNAANNIINAGSGNDEVEGGFGNDIIIGGLGDDVLSGQADNDTILGGSGLDTIEGGAGSDSLGGGDNADVINGGLGNDTIGGGNGNDNLSGNAGLDLLVGGSGNDTVSGGIGSDIVIGGVGMDTLNGDGGFDVLYGGTENDLMSGGAGNDTLGTGDGNDTAMGGGGDDAIGGGEGADSLMGGADNDTIFGGNGNDTITGGTGNDLMGGGTGADSFVFFSNFGDDDIFGFSLAQGDDIRIDDALWTGTHGALTDAQVIAQFSSFDASGNVVLSFPDGSSITLNGVNTTTGLSGALDVF